jgi:hypothetical protein
MYLQIEAVTKEPRIFNGRTFWGVKSGGKWFDFYQNEKPKTGFTYSVDISETVSKGKTYYKAEPTPGTSAPAQPTPAPSANGNGAEPAPEPQEPKDSRIPMDQWIAAMKAFHDVAIQLEPDTFEDREQGSAAAIVTIDRSAARVSILQTCLVTLRDNKIAFEVPEVKEGTPPF